MVSNTDVVIISSIGFISLGSVAIYTWKQFFYNAHSAGNYIRRIRQINDPRNLLGPEDLKEEFKNMTDDEKKQGKELLVMGNSLSYQTYLFKQAGKFKIEKPLVDYLNELNNEIMVTNRFYPNYVIWIGNEDKSMRETFGNKFAIENDPSRRLLIEPYLNTEMLGFSEFFHRKRTKWYQRLWDGIAWLFSTDPYLTYSFSSSILFEGDYITAFGLVSYNIDRDAFTMTKPLAVVKGGIYQLVTYFREKLIEKALTTYGY